MNGVQTRFKCKLDVKRCKRFVFPPSSLLPRSNALKTKAIRYFQTDRTLTRIVSPPLVEPEKPIVFYIENSTPYRWRKYIKQGIEDWQVAFERAGFKNAIIAKELPDSIAVNADDINYSVVTYAASSKANAMGPSILDPRSGEILEADIMWWHNVISMVQEWITVQTGAIDPKARGTKLPDE